ncbi:MAG: hypothetical protein P8M34_05075 [Saprospiraceae bacterium]|nr:hypothetical protein [Saprospiraceae bacterium]|tara:strand:- start:515 stop:1852 length:1338 start_codon:yes stop_codon:yes gene_type:complete
MNESEIEFLGRSDSIYKGKAPARLDVMGGIADYSGSLVLQMPLDLYTEVIITKRNDQLVRIKSEGLSASLDLHTLMSDRGNIVSKKLWKHYNLPQWSLYVFGCVFVIIDERSFDFKGLNIFIKSDVPQGKGISSSAALEVATLAALFKVFNLKEERESLAVLAQKAENEVAEAPCGIMDQMTVHLGRRANLLPIRCQPFEVGTPIPILKGVHFVGIDTGIKHAVSGSMYSKVRTATFMGWSIILQSLGLKKSEVADLRDSYNEATHFDNYLCNITPKEFRDRFIKLLPQQISGKEFSAQYGITSDPLSIVNKGEIYNVRVCTQHPIYENHRIHSFQDTIQNKSPDLSQLGVWMMESHEGYRGCGLSCPEADYIVELVKSKVTQNIIYGARITGGGSGGTVCILTKDLEIIKEIQHDYDKKYQRKSIVFIGSGEGAYYLNQDDQSH